MTKTRINEGGNRIARYFSVESFLSFIETDQLHFTCIDKFEDVAEGFQNTEESIVRIEETFNRVNRSGAATFPMKTIETVWDTHKKCIEYRKSVYANCWTKKSTESVALWKIFSNNGNGILFYQDINQLKSRFTSDIISAEVDYKDYIDLRPLNPEEIPFHKKIYFDYESEYRFVVDGNKKDISAFKKTDNGLLVKITKNYSESHVVIGYGVNMQNARTLKNILIGLGYPQGNISYSVVRGNSEEFNK